MRRFFSFLFILFISLGLMGSMEIPQNYTIRVGLYENAPKIYTSSDGKPAGFWPEIIKYLAAKEGWTIQWVPGTWDECLNRLDRNEIDLMPDVGWTPERAERFTFTQETVLTSWARVYVRPHSGIQTILDLKGKMIAGLEGSLNFDGSEGIKVLTEKFGVQASFVSYSNYSAVFNAVKNGQADAGIANKDIGDLNEEKFGLEHSPIILQPAQIRFALPKNGSFTSYLTRTIDKDIAQLKSVNDSAYYKALYTYLGEKPVEVTPAWVTTSLPVASVIVLVLLIAIVISRVEIRRQTEKLRTSEIRYRALLENYPDLILRISREGVFLDYHIVDESTFTTSPGSFMSRNVGEIFSSDVAKSVMECITKALNSHEVVVREYVLPGQNGQHDYEVRFSASGDSEVIAIVRDITDRKKAERALYESEERYHTLARVSPVGIFRTDVNGSTNYVNPTWSQISGLSPEEAMGDGWLKAVHPEDRDAISRDWEKASSEHQRSQADYRFIRPDGSIAWVIGQAVPELNADNQIVGYVGTITDITDRKEAETALKRSLQAEKAAVDAKETIQAANLALSKSLDLNEVLKIMLDYLARIVPYDRARVILVNDDNRLELLASRGFSQECDDQIVSTTLANFQSNPLMSQLIAEGKTAVVSNVHAYPGWEEIGGKDRGKSWMGVPLIAGMQGVGLFSLDKKTENFFTPEYQSLAESLAAQAAVAIQNARLHAQLRKHAEELEARVAERTEELARRVAEVESLNRETQTLNESLKEAVKKAESADRLKSAFLATMSHELRTPLNSIIGFTGILLQKMVGPLSEEQEKQLKMVQGSARHLLDLINDVLDISKIEADQIVLFKEEFDVGESMQRSLDKVRPMADKKGLQLSWTIDPPEIKLFSDRRRVEQILLNLLNNAIKFTEQGQVDLTCRAEDEWMVFSVSDTGIGMKPADLELLFKPFKQIDSGITRQYEGTGLGLSICKRLVELLGGQISVESEYGKGSTFRFTLPRKGKES